MLDTENYLQRSSCTPFITYLLSVLRRARRRVLSADTAYAPPERPARIRVGFSGVSAQPLTCACAGRAATRARARVANKKVFFICSMSLFVLYASVLKMPLALKLDAQGPSKTSGIEPHRTLLLRNLIVLAVVLSYSSRWSQVNRKANLAGYGAESFNMPHPTFLFFESSA
jgi:hypothetical protein